MVQVHADGLRLELVDELRIGRHLLLEQGAVHLERVEAVKVHRVRPVTQVREPDADALALDRAEGRSRHVAVVGPRGEHHPGGDLDLLVDGMHLEGAQNGAVR